MIVVKIKNIKLFINGLRVIFLSEKPVLKGYFKCFNQTKYIIHSKVCNKIVDCLYGSDELNCEYSNFSHSNCQISNLYSLFCKFPTKKINQKKNYLTLHKFKNITMMGDDRNINLNNSIDLLYLSLNGSRHFLPYNSSINFPNLMYLLLVNSNISSSSQILQKHLSLLSYLDLTHNPLTNLIFISKISCDKLKIFKISETKISYLSSAHLKNCKNLLVFEMSYCFIKSVDKDVFQSISNLKYLFMDNLKISNKNFYLLIKSVKNLEFLKTTNKKFCCLINYAKNIDCLKTKISKYRCTFYVQFNVLNIFLWIIGLMGILFNSYSVYLNFKLNFQSKTYTILLVFSHWVISVYILFNGIVELYYGPDYILFTESFKESPICKIFGSLMLISYFLSVKSTVLLSAERYFAITKPFSSNYFTKISSFLCIFLLIFQISINFLLIKLRIVKKKFIYFKLFSIHLLFFYFRFN